MRSGQIAREEPTTNNVLTLATHEPSQAAQENAPPKRSLRGRSGCLNCRRRRKKCDEYKPTCAKCERFGENCEWDSGLSFRLSGIDAKHPSMIAGNRETPLLSSLQMVDVTFDPETHVCTEFLNGEELVIADDGGDEEGEPPLDRENGSYPWNLEMTSVTSLPVDTTGSRRDAMLSPDNHAFRALNPQAESSENIQPAQSFDQGEPRPSLQPRQPSYTTPMSSNNLPVSAADLQAIGEDDQLLSLGIPELEPLDYLTDGGAGFQPGFGDSLWPSLGSEEENAMMDVDRVMAESPDMYAMYYPNATYRELHTTLYNHMVETARGTDLTRQATPETQESHPDSINHDVQAAIPLWEDHADGSTPSNLPKGMTVRREMELWRNYLDEIALWLDMFDNERHFQHHLPTLAQTSEPLRFSTLALSARQMERKDPSKPYTESLALYQEAIRLVAMELEGMSTAVIASCMLLCVLEMMSSSPRDWSRHLEGCAMLLKAAGINGVVGGMRQAIFWCFARMDMWGGFLSDSHTKIPTSLWFLPTGSMATAISRFKTDFRTFDSYANYAVFLCASVLNVVSHRGANGTPTERSSSYTARWRALYDLLEDWAQNRPPQMRPLTPTATAKDTASPFPTILYTNAPAVSGNQLYHTAALLMLQAVPRALGFKPPRSIFWHARQICGITASNHSHSAYTNALQPLWFAGKVMSSKAEHAAVLELLRRIETETGFATQWRAQDLMDYWGDEGD